MIFLLTKICGAQRQILKVLLRPVQLNECKKTEFLLSCTT